MCGFYVPDEVSGWMSWFFSHDAHSPPSAVHHPGGLLILHSGTGRCSQSLDLWRAAEDSTDPFSLSTSSLCATPERQGLPAMPSENQHRFFPSLHRNPGCSLELDLRPLSQCLHQSEALSGGREEDWAPCFDHRVLLMGTSKGAY